MMEVQIVTLTKDELDHMLTEAARKGAEQAIDGQTKKWLNQKDAAAYLGLSIYALRDRHHTHNLPVYRDRRTVRYLKSDLDAMVQGKRW